MELAAAGGPPETLMLDATHVKAHRSAAGGKGGHSSRQSGGHVEGRTTKIHAAVDEYGRPRRLIIGPGHRGDAPVGAALPIGYESGA